jgi:hypothetical protein
MKNANLGIFMWLWIDGRASGLISVASEYKQ